MKFRLFLLLGCILLPVTSCAPVEPILPTPPSDPGIVSLPQAPPVQKWALWADGTQLRGANTWQRVVVPELDGLEFLGDGYVGPPYTQADFDALRAAGANYVNLSHPGIFTERSPYVLDEQVLSNLDEMIAMAERADLFVVITFRTGPGRSDFTFYRDGAGDWFDPDLLIETVWSDPAAQQAWAEMWRFAAERYRDNPVVVGYDLMCEPNADDVVFGIYEPSEFYPRYAGTVYDWNQFYPLIVAAIREVDPETPVLVNAAGWGGVRWLPYLEPVDDPRVVYTVHQYAPHDYTHQDPPPAHLGYPGWMDLDWDGTPDRFDREWLDGFLGILDEYQARTGAPLAVNEFGVVRWVPGAAEFLRDEFELFEARGLNYAFWVWDPDWPMWNENVNGMNYRYGLDPWNASPVENPIWDAVLDHWSRNLTWPSLFTP